MVVYSQMLFLQLLGLRLRNENSVVRGVVVICCHYASKYIEIINEKYTHTRLYIYPTGK